MEFGEGIEAQGKGGSKEDNWFDSVVGSLEDIVVGPEFEELTQAFLTKHCEEFEDTEENKFVYTDIHKEFTGLVESFLESELARRVKDFNMERFMKLLEKRKEEVSEDIMDTLIALQDFVSFKDMMVQHKRNAKGEGLFEGLIVNNFAK